MTVECEEPFDVSGTGRSEEAARDKAYQNAADFCQKTHADDCPGTVEVGTGTFRNDGSGNITYITQYKCTIIP